MSSTKKLTVSNKDQLRVLVQKMEQSPAIARGQRPFGQSKQGNDNYWEQLSNELNSLGPPVRKRQDWQRVWTNYKQNLRRKVSNNRQNVQATGGGPSEEVPLTALEETVAGLLNTRVAVSPAGRTIGVSIEENDVNLSPPSSPTPPTPCRSRAPRTPQVSKRQKMDAIEEQTKNQEQIIKKLDAIDKSCYKSYQVSKKMLEIKKEKLKILKKKKKTRRRYANWT